MRWLRRLGLIGLVLLVVAIAWEPSRVGIQTAVMLPSMLGSGPAPLAWFSDPPQRTAVEYRPGVDGGEAELAELWLPAWASADERAGAVLLVLGVNNVGRNHPVVERVADALARTGVAVLVPDSALLLEGRLNAGEVDGVVRAYETLAARPEVDPERVGIAGFSVGGSLALLAAADERIASDVRWVNAFGAFADAETYLAAVASHAYVDAMAPRWTGSHRTWRGRCTCDSSSTRSTILRTARRSKARWPPGSSPANDRRPERGASLEPRHRCRSARARPSHRAIARRRPRGHRRAAPRQPGVPRCDLTDPEPRRDRGGRLPHARVHRPPRPGGRVASPRRGPRPDRPAAGGQRVPAVRPRPARRRGRRRRRTGAPPPPPSRQDADGGIPLGAALTRRPRGRRPRGRGSARPPGPGRSARGARVPRGAR